MTCGNLIGSHVISYSIYASDVFTDVTVVLWRKLFPAFDMNLFFFFYYYYLLPFSCRSKPNRVCRHLSRLTSEEQLFPPSAWGWKTGKKKSVLQTLVSFIMSCPGQICFCPSHSEWRFGKIRQNSKCVVVPTEGHQANEERWRWERGSHTSIYELSLYRMGFWSTRKHTPTRH